MKSPYLFFFVQLLPILALSQYYVDPAGSNSNSGLSIAQPWRTIQKAANSALPGSTVYIRGGVYHENVVISQSGLLTSRTVFTNYNNESVILDGDGTAVSDGTTMIRIDGAKHIEIRNMEIRDLLCPNATGIRIANLGTAVASDIVLINLKINDINWTLDDDLEPSNVNNSHPLLIYGSGATLATAITAITIEGCEIYENITGFSEGISINGNVDGFKISNCIVRNNTNAGITIAGNYGVSPNSVLDHARNGVIKNNVTNDNKSGYSSSGGIYIDGGWNISIENNESFDNHYGIELGCEKNGTTQNITVKNNVLHRNINCGIYIGGFNPNTSGQVLSSVIRNNTIFNNDLFYEGNGEIQISKASNCTITNNIFYTHDQHMLMSFVDIEPQSNNNFDYNCWFTPNNDPDDMGFLFPDDLYTSFEQYRQATGFDTHSFYGDPKLHSPNPDSPDLSLDPTSPCIDNADSATAVPAGETDFSGLARILGILDIGAYEYTPALATDDAATPNPGFYPNPAHDTIHFDDDVSDVHIYTLSGQLVAIPDNGRTIAIDGLSRGTYLIKWQSGNSVQRRFVIKI